MLPYSKSLSLRWPQNRGHGNNFESTIETGASSISCQRLFHGFGKMRPLQWRDNAEGSLHPTGQNEPPSISSPVAEGKIMEFFRDDSAFRAQMSRGQLLEGQKVAEEWWNYVYTRKKEYNYGDIATGTVALTVGPWSGMWKRYIFPLPSCLQHARLTRHTHLPNHTLASNQAYTLT